MLLDKPAGITSHDAVQLVRRALGTRAAGHTGTLDPFATGLLVVLVGRATRLARFVEAQAKTYLATARLGLRTDTDDRTGAPLGQPVPSEGLPEAALRTVLAGFAGTQMQQPPSYSAKHVGGERSYRRARRGELVSPAEVEITVHAIDLVAWHPPDVSFRATVSPGTYLRAIGRDLGDRLGVGGHLVALRREAIGPLRVEDALPPGQLTPAALLPPDRVLRHLPAVELELEAQRAVAHGQAVRSVAEQPEGGAVMLMGAGQVVAVAEARDGWLRPTVVLAPG